MNETKKDWTECSTVDLISMQQAVGKNLSNQEDIEMFKEIMRRLHDYSKISTGFIKVSDETKPEHDKHTQQLKDASTFYNVTINALGPYGLIDFTKPVAEWGKGASTGVSELLSKTRRLQILIGEIYCMHFACKEVLAIDALPDDVRASVTQQLKNRKLIRED